jgi:hypothetical protein
MSKTGLYRRFVSHSGLVLGGSGNGLFVGHLRLTNVDIDFKLLGQTLADDLQMQFSHPGQQGLSRILVIRNLKVGSSADIFARASEILF